MDAFFTGGKNKDFPSLAALNGLEYDLGYVIIDAIKDIWGFDAVINLIKMHSDTQTVLQVSPMKFEEKIYGHIYKKYIQKLNPCYSYVALSLVFFICNHLGFLEWTKHQHLVPILHTIS